MTPRFTKPYIDALFAVAGSLAAAEALLPGLSAFAQTLDASPDLQLVLKSPSVDRERKLALVEAVAARHAVPPLASRFLAVLLQNRRLFQLPQLVRAVRDRLDRDRGELEASLTTAVPMSAERTREIVALLEKKTSQKVRVTSAVDPALLGGFVVRVGSEVYDASLAHRLLRARQALHQRS